MAKQIRDSRLAAFRRPAFVATLEAPAVRRLPLDDRTLYSLPDFLGQVVHATDPLAYWREMVKKEPVLREFVVDAPLESENGLATLTPATDMYGMMRIVQSIPHSRAEAARRWLAAAGVERLEELADPELAVARAREEFQRRGYPQGWIDQRMRAMSARAQIVGEWHKRGAAESSHYRELTNALFHAAFGMEVEAYRKVKGLAGSENLRDHMSEVELALVTLGETVGAELHRLQGSHTLHELVRDMHDAGVIVAGTRRRIEEASGKQVLEKSRKPWAERRELPGIR